jgi:hypothetical protein
MGKFLTSNRKAFRLRLLRQAHEEWDRIQRYTPERLREYREARDMFWQDPVTLQDGFECREKEWMYAHDFAEHTWLLGLLE